jgi:excisionase family DNA binding protein
MKVENRLFSIAEVAECLSMSKDTISGWSKARRLKASPIGRIWHIHGCDLKAFIDNSSQLQPRTRAQKANNGDQQRRNK